MAVFVCLRRSFRSWRSPLLPLTLSRWPAASILGGPCRESLVLLTVIPSFFGMGGDQEPFGDV